MLNAVNISENIIDITKNLLRKGNFAFDNAEQFENVLKLALLESHKQNAKDYLPHYAFVAGLLTKLAKHLKLDVDTPKGQKKLTKFIEKNAKEIVKQYKANTDIDSDINLQDCYNRGAVIAEALGKQHKKKQEEIKHASYYTFEREEAQPQQPDKIDQTIAKIPKPIRTAFNFTESTLEYGLSLPTTIALFGSVFNKNYPLAIYPAVTFTMGIVGGTLKTDAPAFRKAGLSEHKLEDVNIINEEVSHILGRYNSAQELAFHVSGLFVTGAWDFAQHPYRKGAFAATIALPAVAALFTGSEKIYLASVNLNLQIKKKLINKILRKKDDELSLLINPSQTDLVKTRPNTKVPQYIYTGLNAGFSAYEFSVIPILFSGFEGYRHEIAFAESAYGRYGRLGIAGGTAVMAGILDYCLQHLEKTNPSAKMYRKAVDMAIRIGMYMALMLDFAFDFNYSISNGDYVSYPVGTAVMVGAMLLMSYLNKQPAPAQTAAPQIEENRSNDEHDIHTVEDDQAAVVIDINSINQTTNKSSTAIEQLNTWIQRKADEQNNTTALSTNRNSSFSNDNAETPSEPVVITINSSFSSNQKIERKLSL